MTKTDYYYQMAISSFITTDYILPIHSAENPENNPKVHTIQIIEILINFWTNTYVARVPRHKKSSSLPLGDDSIFPYLILLMILRRVKDSELSAPGKQLWEQEEIA